MQKSWEVWNMPPEATGEISAALGEKWVNLKYSLQNIDLLDDIKMIFK